jgi:group I intron endonuclease
MMIIYKTSNKVNGHYYIGKDQKNNPKYLGSGLALNRAIKKYGRENFIKEILEICNDKIVLAERERFWISAHNATQDPSSYNIASGGFGGNTGAYHKVGRSGPANAMYGRTRTEEEKLAQSKRSKEWMQTAAGREFQQRNIVRLNTNNPGKNKSTETKKRISESKKGKISRIAVYSLISPSSEQFEFYTKEKLTHWCKLLGHSVWTIERRLLHSMQPKSGSLVGWSASVKYS